MSTFALNQRIDVAGREEDDETYSVQVVVTVTGFPDKDHAMAASVMLAEVVNDTTINNLAEMFEGKIVPPENGGDSNAIH